MKTFAEYLSEGSSLMKDKKIMDFVNKVVKELIKPSPRYVVKKIEKSWKKKNGIGVTFELHYNLKSYSVVDSYKIETFNIDGNLEDVSVRLLDKRKINKPSDDDWEN
jgi:hypothetical protein